MRFSFTSRPPRRLSKVLKCFLVAVVTVLMTAPSNKDGDDDDRLDEMNCSCLVEGSENKEKIKHATLNTFLLNVCIVAATI